MLLRILAVLFGIVFIFAGVAGFMPDFTTNGTLFGVFQVDTLHSIAHTVTGVIAIMAATSYKFTKLFFQIFGIIYAVAAIIGFWRGGDLFITSTNFADNILHTIIGVVMLYLGFFVEKRQA